MIIGVFVHKRIFADVKKRPIGAAIKAQLLNCSCVNCGEKRFVEADHKNDMYNDERVLDVRTQHPSDFQALCRSCNLKKRTFRIKERLNHRLFSAKSEWSGLFSHLPFEFPWEKKSYDPADINNKTDTYWHDPTEFRRKIFLYGFYYKNVVLQLKKLNT